MVLSRERKSEHKKNLIGESNHPRDFAGVDYEKLKHPERIRKKGQTKLEEF